jgi:hypothetical protein
MHVELKTFTVYPKIETNFLKTIYIRNKLSCYIMSNIKHNIQGVSRVSREFEENACTPIYSRRKQSTNIHV